MSLGLTWNIYFIAVSPPVMKCNDKLFYQVKNKSLSFIHLSCCFLHTVFCYLAAENAEPSRTYRWSWKQTLESKTHGKSSNHLVNEVTDIVIWDRQIQFNLFVFICNVTLYWQQSYECFKHWQMCLEELIQKKIKMEHTLHTNLFHTHSFL